MAQDLSSSTQPTGEQDSPLPFLLLEQSPTPGGRAASSTTPEGFTFDYGGHVLFPHAEYAEFAQVLDQAVAAWHHSTPVRGVWMHGRLIPTPVQRNIHRLPLATMAACLWGLWRRRPVGAGSEEPTLRTYLESLFGRPLTRHVMGPLNHKMWAHAPEVLGSAWSSHASGSKEKNIPEVRIRSVMRNLLFDRDEPGWTDATTVRYPLHGGMGVIWDRVFASVPECCRRLAAQVVTIDSGSKTLHLQDKSIVHYEKLVTSIPLDTLLRLIADQPVLAERAHEFRAAKVQLFGFGIRGTLPALLEGVHALSVPSPAIPFWRVNIPSNFSPGNVPGTEDTWSILCECSIAPDSALHHEPAAIEAALRQMELIPDTCEVISTFTSALRHGYPVPFAGRDALLNEVQSELESLDIYSRGRFGGWRYEVSNQDHAFMQGVEVIDRLERGKPEYTYRKTW